MNLPLEPGRRCLIAPWAPHNYKNCCCTLVSFFGSAPEMLPSGLFVFRPDWWHIDVDGVGSVQKCPDPNCPGHGIGARAAWLIPLPGDDEGKKMFDGEDLGTRSKKPVSA
jgi:hypothetical protein